MIKNLLKKIRNSLTVGKKTKSHDPKNFYTPLEEAVEQINIRRNDPKLLEKVVDYLNGDIPHHFDQEQPILYLSRHIATPNYEALRFIELGKQHGLPLVIGQDKKGKFVSHNELKRALGKLPITKGFSHRQDEIIEKLTVVDFAKSQGKAFYEIETKHGKNLVDFHNSFFQHVYPGEVLIIDESEWIDRNHRENLKEQYKKMLALCIVHGIMFETFLESEQDVTDKSFGPAFNEVSKFFGMKPLVVEHIDPEMELTRDWNGYPSVLYQYIKNDVEGGVCE